MRKIDIESAFNEIIKFIRIQHKSSGMKNAIVGLSGGIDSSLTVALCIKALGKENVYGVMLPYSSSHPDSLNHALEVAKQLQISHDTVDISPMVDSYFSNHEKDSSKLRMGNFMARTRMCILYDKSAKYGALVAGTGNKSELLIGYCTQYGDSACAYEPIGELYKTEVWEMAKFLDLPKSVIEKAPTADLWSGQTDESEMGITYKTLDDILYRIFDLKITTEQLLIDGFSSNDISKVIKMYNNSKFKRIMPPIGRIDV